MFQVYKITNQINGRAYIGATTRRLIARWKAHVSRARNGRKGILCDAIRLHGKEAFMIEHLASARTLPDLYAAELILIEQERTLEWQGGYNGTLRGVSKSPEHRAHLALAKMGSTASAETRAKMSKAHRGRSHSPEWVRNQAATLKGRPKSPEHRAKLSAAQAAYQAARRSNPC